MLWEMSASSIRSDFNTSGTETTVSKVLSHVVIDKNKKTSANLEIRPLPVERHHLTVRITLCLLALNSGER